MTIVIPDWRRTQRGRTAAPVHSRLDSLSRRGWDVLHEIPTGLRACEIDHLLIGPAGVFAVNTHHHAGSHVLVADYSMSINGTPVPYLRNAKFEAERAAHLLGEQAGFEVPVRGCVVILGGTHAPQVNYARRPIGVSVLTKADVPRFFRLQAAVLSPNKVAALSDAARRSSTWD